MIIGLTVCFTAAAVTRQGCTRLQHTAMTELAATALLL